MKTIRATLLVSLCCTVAFASMTACTSNNVQIAEMAEVGTSSMGELIDQLESKYDVPEAIAGEAAVLEPSVTDESAHSAETVPSMNAETPADNDQSTSGPTASSPAPSIISLDESPETTADSLEMIASLPELSPAPTPQTPDSSIIDPSNYPEMVVANTTTYLGLRSTPEKTENETGQLKNGSVVNVINQDNDEFWYVYSQELKEFGYVTSRYLISLPLVYEAASTFSLENHFGTIEVPIPQIRMDTPEIQRVNQEIAEDFLAFDEDMERNECMGVYYEWHVNDDILSLVIQKEYVNDGRAFYVKNVSLSQQREATNEEILQCRGISREQFEEMASNAISSHISATATGGENYDEYIERSIAEDNINASEPFLSDNKELMLSTKFYFPAGGGTHNALFDLDTGEVIWYVENKTVTEVKYAVGFQTTLNLRQTPDEDAWILESIPLNEAVGVLYTVDSVYSRVKYHGIYGYVKSEYLGDYRMTGDYGAAFAEVLRDGDHLYWIDPRFQLTDLDYNGTPELIVAQGFAHVCNVEIYAYIDGATCFVGNVGSFGSAQYSPTSRTLKSNYTGQGSFVETVYTLKQGELTEQYEISGTVDFDSRKIIRASVNGAETAESDFSKVEQDMDALGPYYSIGYETGWEVNTSNIQVLEDDPERLYVESFS